MIKEENSYSELISIIIESALTVHKLFGSGFQKEFYKRALEIELNLRGLKFNTAFKTPVFYKGEQIGTRGVDLLVEELVSVDLKVNKLLEEEDYVQVLTYLESNDLEMGLLINFGAVGVDYKRIVNKNLISRGLRRTEDGRLRTTNG